MSGIFNKLVPEIVKSSVWDAPPEIRCVWITILAVKDVDGFVRGTPESLARMANISQEFTNKALEMFLSPDASSRSQNDDGRRLKEVPGGWHVINHEAYRAKSYKAYQRERMQEYRQRLKEEQQESVAHKKSRVANRSVSASLSASASGKGGSKGGNLKKMNPEWATDEADFRAKAVEANAKRAHGTELDTEQLEAFCDYWTARNKTGEKMAYELCKTWSMGGRLATWHRNNESRSTRRAPVVTSMAQRNATNISSKKAGIADEDLQY